MEGGEVVREILGGLTKKTCREEMAAESCRQTLDVNGDALQNYNLISVPIIKLLLQVK